jgi:hypothetical protein
MSNTFIVELTDNSTVSVQADEMNTDSETLVFRTGGVPVLALNARCWRTARAQTVEIKHVAPTTPAAAPKGSQRPQGANRVIPAYPR